MQILVDLQALAPTKKAPTVTGGGLLLFVGGTLNSDGAVWG